MLSSTLLNEFRVQFARENRPRSQVTSPDLPDTSIGPCTQLADHEQPGSIPGCLGRNFRFGRPFFHPSFGVDKQVRINDNFSIVHGQHAIKIGFNTMNSIEANFFEGFAPGRFTFDTVEGFLNCLNFGPTFLECSDGSTSQDERHNFAFYSIWEMPGHITWFNTMYAHSSRPRSLLGNFDANGDTAADADRVFTDGQGNFSCGPGGADRQIEINGRLVRLVASLVNGHDVGRNSARFPDVGFAWNSHIERPFRLSERFQLKPSVDIYNLTNNDNLFFPSCSELATCFQGTIAQVPGDSRRAQLGLRLEW